MDATITCGGSDEALDVCGITSGQRRRDEGKRQKRKESARRDVRIVHECDCNRAKNNVVKK